MDGWMFLEYGREWEFQKKTHRQVEHVKTTREDGSGTDSNLEPLSVHATITIQSGNNKFIGSACSFVFSPFAGTDSTESTHLLTSKRKQPSRVDAEKSENTFC